MESLQVQFGAVAFVPAETILRKLRAEFAHQAIARHLRDHARGGDAQAQAIAIDQRRLREWKWQDRQTIDQDMLRRIR